MLAKNSNNGRLPNNSKIMKSNPNQTPKVGTQARSTTKKAMIDVSNISVSIRSSRKATGSSSSKVKPVTTPPPAIETNKSEIGVQVDEVEIIANDCDRTAGVANDAPVIRLPSVNIVREIEKSRKLKKEQQLKARLNETRKFEEHAAKQEIHLTNLKEFLDTGAISRKRGGDSVKKVESDKKGLDKATKDAIEAYDRIKRKEDELLKLFNSI